MAMMEIDERLPRPQFDRHLPAQLRSRTGRVNEVRVVDLSIAGCLIERQAMTLDVGDSVLIRLPGLSYMRAAVVWAEEYVAALELEETLHDAVYENQLRAFVKAAA